MRDLQWTSVANSIAVAPVVEPDDLRIPDVVTALTGVCARSVKASIMGHILSDDGAVYAIKGRTLVPVTDRGGLFKRPSVATAELPLVQNARFVNLASVGYHRTAGGLAKRYVGLWEGGGNWLITDFSVPDGGGKSIRTRTLLSSSLPLRSVAYFPAPDTPSGSLFLVQEASPSEIRLIRLEWDHPLEPALAAHSVPAGTETIPVQEAQSLPAKELARRLLPAASAGKVAAGKLRRKWSPGQIYTAASKAPKSRPIRVIMGAPPLINSDCEAAPKAQVRDLTCSEAADLIMLLKQAQAQLGSGKLMYLELLSGGFASSPMARLSPREVFTKMRFEEAEVIERVRTENRSWQPYKLSYASGSKSIGPMGLVEFYWDVEVVLGFTGRIERVQLTAKPPPPH